MADGVFDEVIRLKAACTGHEEEIAKLRHANAQMEAAAVQARKDLLCVTAERDALQETLMEVREHMLAQDPQHALHYNALASQRAAKDTLAREIAALKEELARSAKTQAVLDARVAQHLAEERQLSALLTTTKDAVHDDALLHRALAIEDIPFRDTPSVVDHAHHVQTLVQRMVGFTASVVKERDAAAASLAKALAEAAEQASLIKGYHSLYRKSAAVAADPAAPGSPARGLAGPPALVLAEDARLAALQKQLEDLRAENLSLRRAAVDVAEAARKEAATAGGGKAAPAAADASLASITSAAAAPPAMVIRALQVEVLRLRERLQQKREAVADLKAVIRRYADPSVQKLVLHLAQSPERGEGAVG